LPIYLLNEKISFPPVDGAEDGIVAVGGDLSPERLLLAYRLGIFPWFNEEDPIIWHSPEERFVLLLDDLHISKSMRRVINSNTFQITYDEDFAFVIQQCANVKRKDEDGTWITKEMRDAYSELHYLGFAHSIEVWQDDIIVGGVYGVSLGKCFFAESMFHTATNASKFAIIKLVELLKQKDFHFVDAQVYTEHVETLGAKEIPRDKFIQLLQDGLQHESWIGKWII
jgi:leucyl/phenylalanyl-tRNA--protein transferase